MDSQRHPLPKPPAGWVSGIVLLALVPCLLFVWRPEGFLCLWAYDLLSLLNQFPRSSPIVLVEMDERSFAQLGQTPQNWDRTLHAALLDRLTRDEAAAVVFDLVLAERGGNPAADEALAAALRRNGRVILAAVRDQVVEGKHSWLQVIPPTPQFATNAAAIGLADFEAFFSDGIIRLHNRGALDLPPLADAAYGVLQPTAVQPPTSLRWIRHYPSGTSPFTRVSYCKAAEQPTGFFRGKIVIIGSAAKVGFAMDRIDQFRPPIRIGSRGWIPGIELHATLLTNRIEHHWLRRIPTMAELALLGAVGLVFTFLLGRWRLTPALVHGAAGCLILLGLGIWAYHSQNLWFGWTLPLIVQYPTLAALGFYRHHRQVNQERDWLDAPLRGLDRDTALEELADLSGLGASGGSPLSIASSMGLHIPDYQLVKQIGRGSYGDVWIAADRLGGLKAVKIVRQVSYGSAEPFRREFRGVEHYTPLSRKHPGLVQVLHVGLDPNGSAFYYVMELADDAGGITPPQADSYEACTLASHLRDHGRLDWWTCARLGKDLADAAGFLHRHGLVHRDIKPSNIIFVGGVPKLADIGLVSPVDRSQHPMSQVGTAGFLPPEGCGSRQADVYAIGRVLEVASGKSPSPRAGGPLRESEPGEESRISGEMAFHQIIRKATEPEPLKRYPDGDTLRDALEEILTANPLAG